MEKQITDTTWYILGAGAIGCLWASYWRLSGIDTVLITPSKRNSSSIKLTTLKETHTLEIKSLTIEELLNSSVNIHYLLVTTKAQKTIAALNTLRSHIDSNCSIVILQNGMASLEAKKKFPNQNVYTAITTDGAYRTAQLSVSHAGKGITYIDCDDEFLDKLPNKFLTIDNCQDIEIRQWQKLAVNCCINGLTVVHHCRNGEILNIPEAKYAMERLCEEVVSIVTALGLGRHFSDFKKQVETILQTTANNYSSMYQDIENQRETEIDMLNGFLVQQALELNVPSFENQKICSEVHKRQALYMNL